MDQHQSTDAAPAPSRVEQAMELSEKVAQDLEVVGAELHLNNTVLDRHLPGDTSEGNVRRALSENIAIEEKVQDAAAELAAATELLGEELAERKRLERNPAASTGRSPG